MVHIEKNKIIIEIETRCPFDDLTEITGGLLHLLGSLDNDMCTVSEVRPVVWLLEAMQPTFEQLNKIYKQ